MNLEELIDERYDSLTPNERELVASILRDRSAAVAMTSVELARHLSVSRTTLARLVRKLGLGGYAEFKVLLGGSVRLSSADGALALGVQEIAQDYRALIAELSRRDYTRVCALLCAAPTVYLYGSGNEQKAVAEEFRRVLLMLGICAVCLFDVGEIDFARERFVAGDVFCAISLSGENRETLQAVRHAQAAGAITVSITRWRSNSLARLCEENLYVGTRTLFQSEGSYEMVAAFYLLIDLIAVRCVEHIGVESAQIRSASSAPVARLGAPVALGALLNSRFPDLTRTERHICTYLVEHRDLCMSSTAEEFARACGVSKAVLIRFAQKLGLDGYSELKARLRLEASTERIDMGRVLDVLIAGYAGMLDELAARDLSSFLEALADARRVYVYGSGAAAGRVASEMARIFLPLREMVSLYGHDMGPVIEHIARPDDLVVIISLSGESPVAVQLARTLATKGVPMVSITRMTSNTVASCAAHSLYVQPIDLPTPSGMVYRSASPSFLLIEYLYLAYRLHVEAHPADECRQR